MGGSTRAILSNNLKGAVMESDADRVEALRAIVGFLYDHAPSPAWGSPEKVTEWLEAHRTESDSE